MFAIVRLYQLLTQSRTMKYPSNCNYNISICSMLHARPESIVDIYYCVCIGIRNWGVGVSSIPALEGSTPSISMHILVAAVFSTRSTDLSVGWHCSSLQLLDVHVLPVLVLVAADIGASMQQQSQLQLLASVHICHCSYLHGCCGINSSQIYRTLLFFV